MNKTKLRARDGENGIPTVSPSLMPFRIAYSGPAPISTYFLTKPFIDADEKRRGLAAGSIVAREGDNNAESGIDHDMKPPNGDPERVKDPLAPQPGPETNIRLSAAFRGRKVVSHNVALPEGYTGLLLTSGITPKAATSENVSKEDRSTGGTGKRNRNTKGKSAVVKGRDRAKALKAKAEAMLKADGKGTRRSRKMVEEDVEEDEGVADGDELETEDELVKLEGDGTEAGEGGPVGDKIFEVAGQFQRFILWHPDVPVDDARDEYTRSLKEWIALATEVGLEWSPVSPFSNLNLTDSSNMNSFSALFVTIYTYTTAPISIAVFAA
jgi:hypothetical protein